MVQDCVWVSWSQYWIWTHNNRYTTDTSQENPSARKLMDMLSIQLEDRIKNCEPPDPYMTLDLLKS